MKELKSKNKLGTVIIVVTWDKVELLKSFFSALDKQSNKDFGVIVLENGSSDGSKEYLYEKAKEALKNGKYPIWVLFSQKNNGFALGNNLAISFALSEIEADCITLLNNDTLPDKDFIEIMLEKANRFFDGNSDLNEEKYPFLSGRKEWKVGSLAPLIENYFEKGKVDSAGIKISPDGSAINRCVGYNIKKCQEELEVFGPSGAAVTFFKKALEDVVLPARLFATFKKQKEGKGRIWKVLIGKAYMNKVGILTPVREFFSSRYFAYFEDVDLAFRMRLRMWGTVFVPQARILHHHSATGKSYSSFKSYHIHRNQYFNIIRDFPAYFVFWGILLAIKRYFLLIKSVKTRKGPASQLTKNAGFLATVGIVIKGWLSLILNLPGLIKERYYIHSVRLLTTGEFREILNTKRFKASLEKMIFTIPSSLKEQKKLDATDKDQID